MNELRIMSIQAHQDDFEFNTGGTFALLRKHYGDNLKIKIVATTRGAFGHHEMTPDETFHRRGEEARKSAAIIDAEYECLRCLDGDHMLGQILIDRNLLGGLWNSIRDFEPHIIFCPPVITDPLAGVHIDHLNTAHAVRQVAYQLCCPNAYPTISGPVKKRVISPIIINVDDVYACESGYDFLYDISEVYETKVSMGLCHRSQIFEWLPFSSGIDREITEEEWRVNFKGRHDSVNKRYEIDTSTPREYFRVTKWGKGTNEAELKELLPLAEFHSIA